MNTKNKKTEEQNEDKKYDYKQRLEKWRRGRRNFP